jgi:hypothetical protein
MIALVGKANKRKEPVGKEWVLWTLHKRFPKEKN